MEESPKWKVLKDVLEDIDKENAKDTSSNYQNNKVIINVGEGGEVNSQNMTHEYKEFSILTV